MALQGRMIAPNEPLRTGPFGRSACPNRHGIMGMHPSRCRGPRCPKPLPALVNPDKLNAFVGRMLGDMGATLSAALVVAGDRLGL